MERKDRGLDLDDIAGFSRYLKLNEVPKLSGDNAFNKIQTCSNGLIKLTWKGIKGFVEKWILH